MNHQPPPPFQLPPDMGRGTAADGRRDSRDHNAAGVGRFDHRRGKRTMHDDGDVSQPRFPYKPTKLFRCGAMYCFDHQNTASLLAANRTSGEDPELVHLYSNGNRNANDNDNGKFSRNVDRSNDTVFAPVRENWSAASASVDFPTNAAVAPVENWKTPAAKKSVTLKPPPESPARIREELGVGDITMEMEAMDMKDFGFDNPTLAISQMAGFDSLYPEIEPPAEAMPPRRVARVTPTEELTEEDPTDRMPSSALKTPKEQTGEKRQLKIAPVLLQKRRANPYTTCSPHIQMLNTTLQEKEWKSPDFTTEELKPQTVDDMKKFLTIPPRAGQLPTSNGKASGTKARSVAKTPGMARESKRPALTPVPCNLPRSRSKAPTVSLLDPHTDPDHATPKNAHMITKQPRKPTKTHKVMMNTNLSTPKLLYVGAGIPTEQNETPLTAAKSPPHASVAKEDLWVCMEAPFTATKAPPYSSAAKDDGVPTQAHEFASFQQPSPQVFDTYLPVSKTTVLPGSEKTIGMAEGYGVTFSNLKRCSIKTDLGSKSLYPDVSKLTWSNTKPTQRHTITFCGKPAAKDLLMDSPKEQDPRSAANPQNTCRYGSPGL